MDIIADFNCSLIHLTFQSSRTFSTVFGFSQLLPSYYRGCIHYCISKMIRFLTFLYFLFAFVISKSNGSPISVVKNPLLSPDDPSTKVVGGEEATPHEFPWIVAFRLDEHHCGGTILSKWWILSAAHCFPSDPSKYTVVVGDHKNNEEEGTEQRRTIERIIKHDNFYLNENDIALVLLSTPLDLNEYVQPIGMRNLVEPDYSPSDQPMLVSGWGALEEGGKVTDLLMKVEVPYVPQEVCKELYGGSRIKETMICGGEGGKDACKGDSGGPLLCMDGDRRLLCGVAAFGTGCARPDKPGVYTKVWHYYDWIFSTLKKYNKEYS